jgi:hypothetical protein
VMVLCGLLALQTVLTRDRRAKPTLIMRGRAWSLRAAALLSVLAGWGVPGVPVRLRPGRPPSRAPHDGRPTSRARTRSRRVG